VERAKGIEPS